MSASSGTRWLPVLAVAIAAVFLVGPALVDPGRRVAGIPGDPAAAVWQLNEMAAGRLGLLEPTTTPSANAPTGAYLRRPIEVSTAAFDVVSLPTAKILGPVVAYNLLLVLAVVCNGLAMLLLARTLRLGSVAATLAALAFAAAPPLLIELELHVALAFAFTIPLVAAFGVRLLERPAFRTAAAAGAITGVSVYINPYLPLYTATVLAAFLVAVIVHHRRRAVAAALAAVGTAALIALPAIVFVLINRARVVAETHRTISELNIFALSTSDYLHALGAWWVTVPVLLAALLGLFALRALTPAWVPLVASGAAGFVLALAPIATLAGVTVRTPSGILFDLFPIWRVVGRASVLVWFVLAVLLGAASSRIDLRKRSKVIPLAVATIVVVAAVAWTNGAFRRGSPWFPVNGDPRLTALLMATPGRVAEYPLFGFDNEMGPYLLRQMLHGRELLNGGIPGTLSADLGSIAGNADDPQARTALAVAGVTRIARHGGAPVPPGLVEIARTNHNAEVYDVPAIERPAVVVLRGAYARERQSDGVTLQWIGDRGAVEVISRRPGPYTLRFAAVAAPGDDRQLRLGTMSLGSLSKAPTEFELCVKTRATKEGVAVFGATLQTDKPATRLGVSDPRLASLAVWSQGVSSGCAAPSR